MTTDIKSSDGSTEGAKEFIQLKKLPGLQEVAKHNPMQILLSQSVALQLKTMKSDFSITELGFNNMMQFIEMQMNDMFQILHRFANIQRRNEISIKDLKLFLKGTGIEVQSLYDEFEKSRYIKKTYEAEFKNIERQSLDLVEKWQKPLRDEELLSSNHAEFFFKDVDILNLVPPTNINNSYVPTWLPEFPPDHTYKFTAIYNKPISDERQMKRMLFEEGKLSEKALLNMLGSAQAKMLKVEDEETIAQTYKESQEETQLIYGVEKQRPRRENAYVGGNSTNNDDLPLNSSHSKGFNIQEYARSRIGLARRKVEEFENHKLQAQKNPFIRASSICSPYGNAQKTTRKAAEREFNILLRRSYVGVLKSIPKLRQLKANEMAAAIERERIKQKEREMELEKKHLQQGVVDLNALHEDALLADLDSTDSEDDEPMMGSKKQELGFSEIANPLQAKKILAQDSTLNVSSDIESTSSARPSSKPPQQQPLQDVTTPPASENTTSPHHSAIHLTPTGPLIGSTPFVPH
ncbi:Taf8p Ecym_4609 [Eremothecium cymbalariae DBVPG|uniref:Transcription initiation factor TFIID subunit 8 n=1 Tax=Eremothecium cymbalariae (strain CBS 270.75 / DBVPG 7215 / KCTC 17166 / NRRL Y-17582) TaxID=931890 RepID=G8JSB6_ERECY|nr:hypothetical protein Ecym_4609 [Eremothecium cymbalariae DBVPG\